MLGHLKHFCFVFRFAVLQGSFTDFLVKILCQNSTVCNTYSMCLNVTSEVQ